MSGTRIRVGVIGASPDGGWAAAAHLPALAALDRYEVSAVATTRAESAARAAETWGARHALTSAAELAGHPDVDLVVVSVRAPAHAAAIRPALAAGKHVLSEWPLGATLAEAEELAAAAARTGVVTAIGLQALRSPSVRWVRDLVAGGAVGRVDAVSMIADGSPLGGDRLPARLAYSAEETAGNNVLSIMTGHPLALLEHVAGELVDLSAAVTYRDPTVALLDSPDRVPNDAPSQVALFGRLAGGALASLAVQGGAKPGPDGFVIRITGTEGTLVLTPVDGGMYPGWATLGVRVIGNDGAGHDLDLPAAYATLPAGVPAGPAANVAALYQEVADAIDTGRPAYPDFATALRYHRLLAAAAESSRTGARQALPEGTGE
jgi:predicted dehydrogenase